MTTTSLDFEAQDRLAAALIRDTLDSTLFVEAGAGTGKTRALVDRVVALVLSGKRIERLVAITFTEKAAGELRDRVRSALEDARIESPGSIGIIDSALSSLDRAPISTIHSFCQQLLYVFAAEAGVDPAFKVQDEVQAERLFQDHWRTYLERVGDDGAAVEPIDRALGLGLTPRDIEALAGDLMKNSDLAWRLDAKPPGAPVPFWPDVGEMVRTLTALPLDSAPSADKLRTRVEQLIALVKSISASGSERESVLASGAGLLNARWGISTKDAWGGGDTVQEVRGAAEDVCQRLNAVLASCRTEALADLLPLIVRFILEDAHERGRAGVLTFNDLIRDVRDLLRDSGETVRSLRDRYDAMLIDEFQDTDPLQVDIARSFASDPSSGALEAGRLFLVGDPKQSIYRFRGADMAIYSQTRAFAATQDARFAELALNRRSRPVILEWVNRVFEVMIGDGDDSMVQPPYHPIHPFRDDSIAGPGVAVIGDEVAGANAREARRVEAEQLAAQCQAVTDEGWEVVDHGVKRPASFADMAILIPARTILPPLERALAAAGIPYRVEGGSLIYRTQEVRDLLNCLTAIDDPSDEVAIVGALRSPAFACSDIELARHKALGGSFNYLSPKLAEQKGEVAEALRQMAPYHDAKSERSLPALIETFASERGLVETGILYQGNRNSFRRVRFVVEQARAFEAERAESLRAFVVWMERRAGEAILDNEGAGGDDDEDAVRVLTIHGAKGLEFPIVFVAGLSWYPSNRSDAYIVDRTTGAVAVAIGASTDSRRFALGDFEHLSSLERDHEDAQHARLLYVAATRARDHLLVSLYHSKGSRTTAGAKRLITNGARELAPARPELRVSERVPAKPFSELRVDAPDGAPEDFDQVRTALVDTSRRKRYTSATALAQRGGAGSDEENPKRGDDTEPWARGRGGTQRGRAVHAAIQSLPLDADDALIDAFSRAQAVAEAIPNRSREVAGLVRWVLKSSQAMERARAAQRVLREVPFAVDKDGVVLEGFVDLLIETPTGIELVDWKTDQVSAADVPGRLEKYRQQAGLYVEGIQSSTGRLVDRITYVFADPQIELSPGDPQKLAEEARRELAG